MAIKKQEFYEGAALYLLARNSLIKSILYESPLFRVNDHVLLYLKYSTRGRSPWGFTFMPDERAIFQAHASKSRIVIGLICGSDGVVALSYDDYRKLTSSKKSAVHIACYRQHGEHYEVNGPDGALDQKVAPSTWRKILEN